MQQCVICNSQDYMIIGNPTLNHINKEIIRHNYKIAKCVQCDFYFVVPKLDLTINEWQSLYDAEYFFEMTPWHKRERSSNLKKRLHNLEKKCKNEIQRFLDVGCGEGYGIIEASSKGWETYAFDIVDNRIEDAKDKTFDFKLGNIFTANYPENYFDVAFMDSVLEHVVNPLDYLKELNRILKPNGVLYIGVPNEDSLFNLVRQVIYFLIGKKHISIKTKPFKSPYHVVGFTKKSIRIIAKKSKFECIELTNFAARFEFNKYRINRKDFWIHFLLLPVDILAIPLRKEAYYEAIFKK